MPGRLKSGAVSPIFSSAREGASGVGPVRPGAAARIACGARESDRPSRMRRLKAELMRRGAGFMRAMGRFRLMQEWSALGGNRAEAGESRRVVGIAGGAHASADGFGSGIAKVG